MDIKIWDAHNKQWLVPMAIYFDGDGQIARVQACKEGDTPISDGWYSIVGEDLQKTAITGTIEYNINLLP